MLFYYKMYELIESGAFEMMHRWAWPDSPKSSKVPIDFNATLLKGKMSSLQEDKELVKKCLLGCQTSWSKLYRRLNQPIRHICHWKKWNFSPQQSEEIFQEVFMSLTISLRRFDFESSLETFAASIAKHKCVSEIRRTTAIKREGERKAICLDDVLHLLGSQVTPEMVLEHSDQQSLLKQALESIEDKCQKILRLKYYEDYSYEEISFLLNLPLGTVSSRLKRCLLELNRLFKRIEANHHE